MANANSTEGVKQELFSWGFILRGRQDHLIAASHAQSEWFVDGIERDKKGRVRRLKRIEADGREILTKRIGNKGWCEVRIKYSDKDREQVRIKEEIRSMPANAEEFRKREAESLRSLIVDFFIGTQLTKTATLHGYEFHPDTLSGLREAVDDIVAVLYHGQVIFKPKLREARLQAVSRAHD